MPYYELSFIIQMDRCFGFPQDTLGGILLVVFNALKAFVYKEGVKIGNTVRKVFFSIISGFIHFMITYSIKSVQIENLFHA